MNLDLMNTSRMSERRSRRPRDDLQYRWVGCLVGAACSLILSATASRRIFYDMR